MRTSRVIVFCTVLVLISLSAQAAWVDPNLQNQLQSADAEQLVRSVVVLRDQVNLPALLDDLARRHAGLARRHYEVITALQEKAAETQDRLLSLLEQKKANNRVTEIRPFWIMNAVTVTAKPDVIDQLSRRSDVQKIFFAYPIELVEPVDGPIPDTAAGFSAAIEPGISATRAPELWALGFDGSTALAGDCDTGADGSHPAFSTRWRGLSAPAAETWYDPVTSTTFPQDYNGHGTHTLGTMVGDDGAGNQVGMAPGALWIAAGVIDRVSIPQTISDAIASFQWFADPDGNPATTEDVPDVINNSWGIGTFHGYPSCDPMMWAAIDGAEAAGVVVVFAAGNEGSGAQTMRMPADRIASDVNAFAVGALTQDATTIAGFSSRGPSDCDGTTIKPEVSAVGDSVRSSMPGASYGVMSGTSMATPHVAGAVVLLRDAFPEASPEDVKFSLYETAVDLGSPGEDNDYGMGRIDVVEAYYHLQSIMANPDGKIFIGTKFSCDDEIDIRVTDIDLTAPSITVTAQSGTETTPETVTLYASTAPGIYSGSILTGSGAPSADGVLQVSDRDTVTVTYIDADDGQGGHDVAKTDTAATDCEPPAFAGIEDIQAGDALLTLSWPPATDDSSIKFNIYRSEDSGGQDFDSPIKTVTGSPYTDTTVLNGIEYFYVVRAADAFGQEESNTVELSAIPIGPDYLFVEDFETDSFSDWTIVSGGNSPDTWTTDNPGDRWLYHTHGLFAIADREASGIWVTMDEQLISPPFDCSGHDQISLQFGHDFQSGFLEYGDVEYSFDNVNWTRIVRYRWNSFSEDAYFDLPELNFHPVVHLRFHYVANNIMAEYWAVDDIRVRGWPAEGSTTTSTTVTTTSSTTTTTGSDDDTTDDTVDDDTADDTSVDDTADDTATDDTAMSDDAEDDTIDAPAKGGGGDDDGGGCCG